MRGYGFFFDDKIQQASDKVHCVNSVNTPWQCVTLKNFLTTKASFYCLSLIPLQTAFMSSAPLSLAALCRPARISTFSTLPLQKFECIFST